MLLAVEASAQKTSENKGVHYLFTQANLMMSEHYNDSALKTWEVLYQLDTTNANACYFIGIMLLRTEAHKADALPYMEKAAAHVINKYLPDDPYEKHAPPLAYYYLARALHINYRFSDAIGYFNIFRKRISRNDPRQKDIDYWINCCNNGIALMKDSVECSVNNMGDSINSAYPEYNPVVTADEQEIIFTSRRLGGMNDASSEKDSDGFYNKDIWISYAKTGHIWTSAKSISNIVNTPGDDASVSVSSGGEELILYRGTGEDGNLYINYLRGTQWSYSQLIDSASPASVNSNAWEPSACMSSDQKTLYFVSNRPGGFGGTDIYKINMDSAGKWGTPVNLGANINTEYDENSPFIHMDNYTLFFSSKGHNTMGGYDVFMSQLDSAGQWGPAQNLGYPVNTPDDDIYFSASADGRRAYYSSVRIGAPSYGEKDIYEIHFKNPLPVKRVAVLVGYIKTADGSRIPNDVLVKTKLVNGHYDTLRTKVNPATGKFLQVLRPNQNYNVAITSQGKLMFDKNFYLPADSSYFTLSRAFFRTSIVLGDTSNVFKPKPKVPLVNMSGQILLNDMPLKPLAGMKIQLIDGQGKVLQTTITDKDGHFTFTKLPSDQSYTIELDINDPRLKHLKKLYLANSKGKIVRNYDLQKNDTYLYHDLPPNLDELSEISRITAIPPKPVRIVSPDADYIEYFKYNADQASDKASSMYALINKIARRLEKDSVTLYIESSASKVPTSAQFMHSNQVLAQKRAEATKAFIIKALKRRHAKYTKVKFEIKASVQGPDYAQDAQAQDKYQNYQYVKVFIR